jgi:hypothetical protein
VWQIPWLVRQQWCQCFRYENPYTTSLLPKSQDVQLLRIPYQSQALIGNGIVICYQRQPYLGSRRKMNGNMYVYPWCAIVIDECQQIYYVVFTAQVMLAGPCCGAGRILREEPTRKASSTSRRTTVWPCLLTAGAPQMSPKHRLLRKRTRTNSSLRRHGSTSYDSNLLAGGGGFVPRWEPTRSSGDGSRFHCRGGHFGRPLHC